MNSCILMADIIKDPQLRYTPDNQVPVAEMIVEFAGLRDEDPPAQLKVVGWGNLAQEIQERYHQGDRVIIEGRLNMNTVDRPEGFKEKRAELTAQRIHLLGAGATLTTHSATPATVGTSATAPAASPSSTPASSRSKAPSRSTPSTTAEPARTPAYSAPTADAVDYDDIPF